MIIHVQVFCYSAFPLGSGIYFLTVLNPIIMNTFYTAVIAIATFLLYSTGRENISFIHFTDHGQCMGDTIRWDQKAAEWLVSAQAPNGGWGAGSHAEQQIRDVQHVKTDPATTAFAAMALLRAGGTLDQNPYRKSIQKALERIVEDIEQRPGNGMITALTGTQPQVKLGGNIDASMALEFLNEMRKQILEPDDKLKVDSAASVCIRLLEAKQKPDGSWADGGWAPILQTTMSINALAATTAGLPVSDSVLVRGSRYQVNNYYTDGLRGTDAAGVPLYVASSIQRSTADDAYEVGVVLSEAVVVDYKVPLIERDNTTQGGIKTAEVMYAIEARGVDRRKAKRMAENYMINKEVTKELQKEEIWDGFGNNGGEEYLSYKMTSESLAKQDPDGLNKWKKEIEPKFKKSQNENGSWSGHHCITSPVFCTAAILQAWYAGS